MIHHPKLYEINAVVRLHELFQKYDKHFTLGDIPPEEWDGLRDLGFDYIWLMGVWKRSKAGMNIFREGPEFPSFQALFDSVLPGWTDADLVGSPYSIASYTPDPMIGNWEDIDRVKEELNKRGMGLILDFVPNHTAPDHPWVKAHPEYYIQGSKEDFKENPSLFTPIHNNGKTLYIARGKDPYFPPWSDTVQLNYFNPDMRSSLIGELKKITRHCDGVRCDMAMLVLNKIFHGNWAREGAFDERAQQEFWTEVRHELPKPVLIAEAYWETEWTLQQLGFDFVYDKRLYDRLRNFSIGDVYPHLKADIAYQKKLVRFIENHDEPRSAEVFDGKRLFASAVLFSTLPGMKLYHHGQLEGRRIKVPLQLRGVRVEEPDPVIRTFYEKLLSLCKHDVFSIGVWELRDARSTGDESFRNIIAYVWKNSRRLKLIVINLTPDTSRGGIILDKDMQAEKNCLIRDEMSDYEYAENSMNIISRGIQVSLEGFQTRILDIAHM